MVGKGFVLAAKKLAFEDGGDSSHGLGVKG